MMKLNHKLFFNEYKKMLGSLSQSQVDALNKLLPEVEDTLNNPIQTDKYGSIQVTIDQMAYILATIKHETADSYEPVLEGNWGNHKRSDAWRRRHLSRYYPYYGRGHVQLTWKDNYAKMGRRQGIDLVSNPDLALDFKVSWFNTVHGMMEGDYNRGGNGPGLGHYVNNAQQDYRQARRTVNVLDKAREIATTARKFRSILRSSYV